MASITRAQEYYKRGRRRDAAAVCRQILADDPGHLDANNLLGIIEFQSGNFEAGLDHLRAVTEARPENVAAQCNLAQAYRQSGKLTESAAAFQRVVELDPHRSDAVGSLAVVLQQLGDHQEAERICRQTLRSCPEDVEVLTALGTVLAMQGRHEEAIDALQRVLRIEPAHATAMGNLANALQEAGRLDEALRLYRRILSINPRHIDALVNMGHLFREKGNGDMALQSYTTALTVDPRCADAHYYAGAVLQRIGNHDSAIKHFRAALAAAPDFERAHWGLQQSFLLKQMPDQARQSCARCLEVLPDNQMTVANQAIASLINGDEERFDYLYDLEFFPYQARINAPAGYGSITTLNEALVLDIMAHPFLKWQHDDYDTSDRAFAYGILETSSPAIHAFERALRAAIDQFTSAIEPDAAHPFFGRIPEHYDFRMWATVLQEGGWHRAHNHEKAWLSGVYYVQCPRLRHDMKTSQSGWIEFDGFTHYGGNDVYEHKVRRVRPEPGLLLFFPSYMLHATRPFFGRDYRISIAFDVTPRQRQDNV